LQNLSAEILKGCWYVAAASAELKPGRMITARLAGEPIVVARKSGGGIFALRDTCPHRGVPLHYGRIVDDTVECPYHGWRFDSRGVCVGIPSLHDGQPIKLGRIRCQYFHSLERYGLVWIYLPRTDGASSDEAMPEPPSLQGVPYNSAPQFFVKMDFPSSIDHSVMSLMDLTHAPYVHNLWWFKREPTKLRLKEKIFEPAPFGFRMKRHKVPPQNVMYHRLIGPNATTEVHYMLPAYRIESICSDRNWVVALTAHTPLDAESTVVYQCFWSSVSWITPLAPVFRRLARTFLAQDRHFVMLQREGLLSMPKLMLINDGDTQARWWMQLKDEWTNAQNNKRPFCNPISERTLRWRS
jgi:phenylpropionate dioxygenase-like ring-hydroxylating dioxygenase large terminal subunit